MYPNNNCTNCNDCPPVITPLPIPDLSHLCGTHYNYKCVLYTGEDIPCLGVTNGMSIDAIFTIFNNLLLTPQFTVNSDCVLSDWSPWSGCLTGQHSEYRCRTIISQPCGSGTACPDRLCESRSCEPPKPKVKANWYNMVARPEDVIDSLLYDGEGTCRHRPVTISINIESFIVNGVEKLSSTYVGTITPDTLNVIAATNTISPMTCLPQSIHGMTYTNYESIINNMITSVGVSHFYTQTSLIEKHPDNALLLRDFAGIYFVFSEDITFEMIINVGYDKLKYTQDNLYKLLADTWVVVDFSYDYFLYILDIPFPLH